MTPHELTPLRAEFEADFKSLGWTKRSVNVQHDRDWDRSWNETHWFGPDGKFLFDEDDLSAGLIEEIRRLVDMLP